MSSLSWMPSGSSYGQVQFVVPAACTADFTAAGEAAGWATSYSGGSG